MLASEPGICKQGKQLEATVRSEHMAEAGDVDGSMAQMQQAEAFQKQHEALHKQFTTPERVMAVCDVCAVFINSTDNDQRRAVRPVPPAACMLVPLSGAHAGCLITSPPSSLRR